MTLLDINSAIVNKALIVLLIPFFTFWLLILFGRIINRYRGYMATTFMLVNLLLSILIFIDVWPNGETTYQGSWSWFSVGDHSFNFGIKVDQLSAMMLLIVTLVSFLVHLFSIEYLRGDRNFEKYFAYLGLFTFSMLGIVLMDSLFTIFIFWELVGLSSYLLIGFWFKKKEAIYASKKAFIVNRIGDAGFIIGLLCIWKLFETFNIAELHAFTDNPTDTFRYLSMQSETLYGNDTVIWWLKFGAAAGLLLGAIGKSAQFPLSVWLPNAMEGPTPVSALIHAATMVAAGVYLMARTAFLAPVEVMYIIAIIGTITAFIAAFTALTQNDIKRVLAFSTISQLGYMFIGIGVGATQAALFHLLTHAFFKACLFLSAGAVIHSMHHVEIHYHNNGISTKFDHQDMKLMGGLRKRMPVTFITYLVSALALAGLPFFSGFLSKDAIIASSWEWAKVSGGLAYVVPIIALASAFMTALYMGRQIMLIFFGEFRLGQKFNEFKDGLKYVIETPILMRIPTVVLAILSIGFVFSLNPLDPHSSWFMESMQHGTTHHSDHTMSIISATLALIGVVMSVLIYSKSESGLRSFKNTVFSENSLLHRLSFNNWYLDEFYAATFLRLNAVISRTSSWFDRNVIDSTVNILGRGQYVLSMIIGWFDKNIVDGAVNLTAHLAGVAGNVVRIAQGGSVQGYIFWAGAILLLILYFILF